MSPIMNSLPVTSESRMSPPAKKKCLQTKIATKTIPIMNSLPVTESKMSPPFNKWLVISETKLSPPAKKKCLQKKIETKSNPIMNSLPVTSESKTSPPTKKMLVPSESKISPPAKKLYLQKENKEGKVIQVKASNQHTDISASKSSLWDWQDLKQDEQVVKPIPSFKIINDLADGGVPTQRRSRHRKYSSKHKSHVSAGTGEKPFVCNICGEGFTREPNLIQHQRVHSAGIFPCPICDKVFKNTDDRLIHVLAKECTRGYRHLKQIANTWHCIKCKAKDFVNREQAERHARGHELGKGMHCPVCLQAFKGDKANDIFRHVKKQHREYIHDLLH